MTALSYDFDIAPASPSTAAGAGTPAVGQFRDPATAAALRRAPAPVRDFMRHIGMDETSRDSAVPAGRYHPAEAAERGRMLDRARAALAEGAFDLPYEQDSPVAEGEFSLGRFFVAMTRATALADSGASAGERAGERAGSTSRDSAGSAAGGADPRPDAAANAAADAGAAADADAAADSGAASPAASGAGAAADSLWPFLALVALASVLVSLAVWLIG